MYKFCANKDKDSDGLIDKLRTLDKNFVLRENTDYFMVNDNDSGCIIGFCAVEKKDDEFILYDIFIDEKKRYRSYGSKLVKYVINHGIRENIKIIISPLKENFAFLKKRGFVFNKEKNAVIYDNIQNANIRSSQGGKVVIWSIIQNAFLAVMKIVGGLKGHSNGILSDGINSLSDVVTSIGILIGLHYSNKPADDAHPYGHEKIECMISIILGILIIITAFELGKWTVIDFLKNGYSKERPSLLVIVIGLISAIVKFFMYRYKLKVGLATNNSALIADSKDSKSDVYSSLSVVVGIVLSIYVHPIFDMIVSLVVAILIFKEGLSVILNTSDVILDKQDTGFIKKIEDYIYNNTEIKNVHDIYMRESGENVFLSLHIRVPGNITVSKAHSMADNLETAILTDFTNVKDVIVHVDKLISK